MAVVTRDYLHEQRMKGIGDFAGQMDWCRAEIEQAISEGKVIIPLVEESFYSDCFSVAARIGGAASGLFNHDLVRVIDDFWEAALDKLVHHLCLERFEDASQHSDWKLLCDLFMGGSSFKNDGELRTAIYHLNFQLGRRYCYDRAGLPSLTSFRCDRPSKQARASFCTVVEEEHLMSNSAIAAQLRKQCGSADLIDVRGAAGCRISVVESTEAIRERASGMCLEGKLQLAGQSVVGVHHVVPLEMEGCEASLQHLRQLLSKDPSLQPATRGPMSGPARLLSCVVRRSGGRPDSGASQRVCATLQGAAVCWLWCCSVLQCG